MGIRESLEKQPGEKDLNLKDLTVEQEPEQVELEIDVEKEIRPQDIEAIKNEMRECENNFLYISNLAELAGLLRVLGLENQIRYNVSEQTEKNIINDCLESTPLAPAFFWRAFNIKLFRPDRISELNIDEKKLQSFEKYFKDLRTNADDFELIVKLFQLKIILPKNIKTIEDENDAQRCKESIENSISKKKWHDVASSAAAFKFLWPEKFFEIKADIIKIWKNMKRDLEKRRTTEWQTITNSLNSYLELLFYMKILASEEVKITDEGMDFIMPEKKSFQQKTPPRPERRNF